MLYLDSNLNKHLSIKCIEACRHRFAQMMPHFMSPHKIFNQLISYFSLNLEMLNIVIAMSVLVNTGGSLMNKDQSTPEISSQTSPPAVLLKSLINSPLFAVLLLTPCGTAWLLKLLMQVCFDIPLSCLELIVCLSCRLPFGCLSVLPSLLQLNCVCLLPAPFGFVQNLVFSKFDFNLTQSCVCVCVSAVPNNWCADQ